MNVQIMNWNYLPKINSAMHLVVTSQQLVASSCGHCK
jgi:hypothetical protein